MENGDNQRDNRDLSKVPKELQPHVFKKGQSGNPAGRPPTKTLKEYARKYLAGMTDKERIEYFEGIDKKVIWEMAEGKPSTQTDITSDGEKIEFVVSESIAHKNDIDTETEPSSQE